MKKIFYLIICLFIISCNNKKLTEYKVEVPLPSTTPDKIEATKPEDVIAEEGSFNLEKINYDYPALSPAVDANTMEMHYAKHYLSFVNGLNKTIKGTENANVSIETILSKLKLNDLEMRNVAGGYYNHSLYFESVTPKPLGEPKDTLAGSIKEAFGSFDNFKTYFTTTAKKQIGSGWAWLLVDKTGKLQVTTTANNDNPLMSKSVVYVQGRPILALDLWEHAYYASYQYKRKNYIDAFFDVIDWKKVGERYEKTLKK